VAAGRYDAEVGGGEPENQKTHRKRDKMKHKNTAKSDLTPACRRLVELMQGLNYGRIEMLLIRGGEPVLDPLPRVVREIRFGKENGARPEAVKADFALKSEVVEFFGLLDSVGDGVIERIDVHEGLPKGMAIREDAAA